MKGVKYKLIALLGTCCEDASCGPPAKHSIVPIELNTSITRARSSPRPKCTSTRTRFERLPKLFGVQSFVTEQLREPLILKPTGFADAWTLMGIRSL